MNNYSIEMKKVVEDILVKYPETRNSDIALYVKVFEKLNYPTDLKNMNFKYNIFMTLTRNRQKIQETNPFLGPTDYVKANRRKNAQRVKEWSRKL